jgi:hypothetical protein
MKNIIKFGTSYLITIHSGDVPVINQKDKIYSSQIKDLAIQLTN